jgi:uncharacterized protein YoxC
MYTLDTFSATIIASSADAVLQAGIVILIIAIGVGGVILWLMIRHWGPAIQRLANAMDQEISAVEKSVEALNENARAQVQRNQRHSSSVRHTLSNMQTLGVITDDLGRQVNKLQQITQQLASETPHHGGHATSLAQHAIHSAERLSSTVHHARQTYQELQEAISEFAAESSDLRVLSEENGRKADALTGAVRRIHSTLDSNRPAIGSHRTSRKVNGDEHSSRRVSARVPLSETPDRREASPSIYDDDRFTYERSGDDRRERNDRHDRAEPLAARSPARPRRYDTEDADILPSTPRPSPRESRRPTYARENRRDLDYVPPDPRFPVDSREPPLRRSPAESPRAWEPPDRRRSPDTRDDWMQ